MGGVRHVGKVSTHSGIYTTELVKLRISATISKGRCGFGKVWFYTGWLSLM